MILNSNGVEDFSNHETTIRIPNTESLATTTMPAVEIHSVCLGPKQSTVQKLRHRLSEIFFPDDPFHKFHGNASSPFAKLLLALQLLFPIFQWGPQYNLRLLRSDVISGLTIASLAIPQVISYSIASLLTFLIHCVYTLHACMPIHSNIVYMHVNIAFFLRLWAILCVSTHYYRHYYWEVLAWDTLKSRRF